MDTLKALSLAAAVVALFHDCDAQGCSRKQFGKDLVKTVKRLVDKFPKDLDWPGDRRWKTICPVKKHLLKRNLTDTQRFLLGTRSLHRYVDLLKDLYLREAVLYGRCSFTNKTKASLDMIKEKLHVISNVCTQFDSSDHKITLKPSVIKRLSAWHALKQIQKFGTCVRRETERENCADVLFYGCDERRRKCRKTRMVGNGGFKGALN